MYKYAQILHDKVHWIFNHEQPLNILYRDYFAHDIELIDITNDNREIEEGWPVVDGEIQEPAPEPEPSKNERIATLYAQYQKDRIALLQQLSDASLNYQDEAWTADIRGQIATLDDKYIMEAGAILNE